MRCFPRTDFREIPHNQRTMTTRRPSRTFACASYSVTRRKLRDFSTGLTSQSRQDDQSADRPFSTDSGKDDRRKKSDRHGGRVLFPYNPGDVVEQGNELGLSGDCRVVAPFHARIESIWFDADLHAFRVVLVEAP